MDDMTKAREDGQASEIPLEEAFRELDEITAKLEDRNIPLEESFLLYRKGMELLKICNDRIDRVEKKMLEINGEGEFSEFSRGTGEEEESGR